MKQTVTAYVYPHTVHFNMAYYSLTTIQDKLENNCREGINLDSANCIISLAFTVEGILNAVGNKIVEDWNEYQPYKSKLAQCLEALNIVEKDEEPFVTMNILKNIRDEMAHPKPTEGIIEVSCVDDVWDYLKTDWQNKCTPEFAIRAFEQVIQFESSVLENEAIAATAFLTESSCIDGY